jgi:hypothetical protein
MAVIFSAALFGGLLPTRLRSLGRRERFLALGNALSGGVFLSAGLTHLLPHAVMGFAESESEMAHGEHEGWRAAGNTIFFYIYLLI